MTIVPLIPPKPPAAHDDPAVVADATDHKTTASRPAVAVVVTMVGTGDGSKMQTGTVAVTKGEHEPNVIVKVVTPVAMIFVRGLKAFMVSFVAILPVAGASGIIPFHGFVDLMIKAASLSFGVGVVAAGNALVEVLTKLDQKFPSWTA